MTYYMDLKIGHSGQSGQGKNMYLGYWYTLF